MRRDPSGARHYVSLTNPTVDTGNVDQRNILTIVSSLDLVTWTQGATLLSDDTGFEEEDSVTHLAVH